MEQGYNDDDIEYKVRRLRESFDRNPGSDSVHDAKHSLVMDSHELSIRKDAENSRLKGTIT